MVAGHMQCASHKERGDILRTRQDTPTLGPAAARPHREATAALHVGRWFVLLAVSRVPVLARGPFLALIQRGLRLARRLQRRRTPQVDQRLVCCVPRAGPFGSRRPLAALRRKGPGHPERNARSGTAQSPSHRRVLRHLRQGLIARDLHAACRNGTASPEARAVFIGVLHTGRGQAAIIHDAQRGTPCQHLRYCKWPAGGMHPGSF